MNEKRVVQSILDIEWDMFQRVRSATPAPCQNAPDVFRKIRGTIFGCWTQEMLESYLNDLRNAQKQGRNLLTEKYARMDNLIPPLNTHPLIEQIVKIETQWQREIKEKYPALYARTCRNTDPTGSGQSFSIYLKCELETYGDKTIELYYDQVKKAKDNNQNLSLRMLHDLVKKGGYESLEQAESRLSKLGSSE